MASITFRQLAGPRRTVTLTGRAGPLTGAEWGVEHPGDANWDPGSREGRALLPGGVPLPTTFEFAWRTADLASGAASATVEGGPAQGQIQSADELVDLFLEALVVERAAVHVRWRYRERVAKLRRFTAPEGRRGEWLACALEVEWLTMGQAAAEFAAGTPQQVNPRSAIARVADVWRQAIVAVRAPANMGAEYSGALGNAFAEVNAAIREGADLADRTTNGQALARHGAGETARALRATQDAATALGQFSGLAAVEIARGDAPIDLGLAAHLRAVTARAAIRTAMAAQRERLTYDAMARGRAAYAYHAADGEDLVVVALRELGSADRWREIASLNGLQGSILRAGQRILIPPRGTV